MTVHTIRDWRGIKVPVGRCTTDELNHMLAEAITATDHIAHFITEIRAELASRGEPAADPPVAAEA
jgi:hypothetical protein